MDEESLFAAALLRATGADRLAFLEEACDGDNALRRRVERLLGAHERTLGILDRPPGPSEAGANTAVSGPAGVHAEERAGTVVAGRYELVRGIGEGGMGTVWMAEQTEPVRRTVALKLIKKGMDSRTILSRFEAERQALALMDHPHIAKVLDGGTTEGGRPFFVMELVRGVPLTRYCDDARLGIARRLELFETVCRAVQHAHTKGIIHRDLKPNNILVGDSDGTPTPKVIDFGLAKALHEPLTDSTFGTGHGVLLGTPLYVSPEQADSSNADVDTRTDIYALGVILYELLTGSTPLERGRLHHAAWHEMLRLIKEEEPPRPSARLIQSDSLPSLAAERQLEPARLTRMVRGELDWIVMKCLEKDRSRRYETAIGLARDVRRYLTDESVEACPPSAGYRLRKFARRNRAALLAASVILLLLVGGIAGTTWGLVRADRAREAEARRAEGERQARIQAQKRLAQIEKGSEILASVFTDLDPDAEAGEDRPLRAILGDRLTYAAGLLEGDAVGDPLVVSTLQGRLGLSLLHLGLARQAVPLLRKAREARAGGLGPDDPATLQCTNNLAGAYRAAGDLPLAIRLHEETLGSRKARLGPDDPATLESMNNLAVSYREAGRLALALPLFEEALRLRKARLGSDNAATLDTMNNLADLHQADGRLELALTLYEEAFRLRKARLGPEHVDTLDSMRDLAGCYRARGDRDRALPLLEESLRLTRARRGPDHPRTIVCMNDLAGAYKDDQKLELALPLYEEALRLIKIKRSPDHPETLVSMNNLAVAYRAARKHELALPLLEETLRLMKARQDPDHPGTLSAMNNLAGAYRAAKRVDLALPLFEETLRLIRAKLAPDHPMTLTSLNNLASCYQDAGKLDLALPLLLEAAAGVEKRKFEIQGAGQILQNLTGTLESLKQFAPAEEWRRKWLAATRAGSGDDAMPYARELGALGANLIQQEKWPEAESALRESLALREAKEPDALPTAVVRARLGRALLARKDYVDAEPFLIRGYEGMKANEAQIPPPDRVRIVEAGRRIIQLYETWGRADQAAEWRRRLTGPAEPRPGP